MTKNKEKSLFRRLKNLIFEVFLVFIVALVIHHFFSLKKISQSTEEICDLLKDNYLKGLEKEDYEECINLGLGHHQSKAKFIENYNIWLRQFGLSHLYISNSAENKKMWEGESKETGIIANSIFGKWKVIDVLAEKSPIEIGDQILSINHKKVVSVEQILKTEGEYIVLRQGAQLRVKVSFSEIKYDERMKIKNLKQEWKYLKIPSFKSNFFSYEELSKVYSELYQKNLVIDLRDNLGGNFVSILRLLSMLECSNEVVGKVFHNRNPFVKNNKFLVDTLDDLIQIQQVMESNPLKLKLFETKLCLKPKKIIVLANRNTASVSELFLQILKNKNPDLKIFGQQTAGQMVLTIWYPLKNLGPGFMISIPYAWATGIEGRILEGTGVWPTEELNTKDLRLFEDSLDPLLDLILKKEGFYTEKKSSLGENNG